MTKRVLSKQQLQRIQKNQQSHVEADENLGSQQEGLLVTHHGATVEVEDHQGQVYRCALRQNLGPLVVGDHVMWQASEEGSGVVVALLPRHSELVRPSRHAGLKPVAANIDLMVIVSAPRPTFSEELLDRYLVAAELLHIEPLIIFNKKDLLDDKALSVVESRLQVYRDIGVEALLLSCHEPKSFDSLKALLKNKTSVFVGQSGVGKSSLTQALLPGLAVKISGISTQGQGRHTTTASRLYHLPEGGDVIDSPGVREFGLWHIDEKELLEGFREFAPFLGECQFRNCQHDKELGCALQKGVAEGKISAKRLESFKKLLLSLGQHEKF